MGAKRFGIDEFTVEDYCGGDAFTQACIGHTDDGNLTDERMAEHGGFDFRGHHVGASTKDHIIHATDNAKTSVLVDLTEILG